MLKPQKCDSAQGLGNALKLRSEAVLETVLNKAEQEFDPGLISDQISYPEISLNLRSETEIFFFFFF